MRMFQCDKIVLKIKNNAQKFLNGLCSNTTDAQRSAFLNVHGRIIATFDQLRISDDEFIIVIESIAYNPLMLHIQKFLALNKTFVEKLNRKVYWDLDATYPVKFNEWRFPQKHGQLVVTDEQVSNTISNDEFVLFRHQYQCPLHGVDYHDELILNVDVYEFVSYTKGCFLGQEPIAKVHHRSKPTWKLVVCHEEELSNDLKLKMTSRIQNPQSGKMQGFVFIKNDQVD